jgi:tetratricopeptide (TPR) repeat protein
LKQHPDYVAALQTMGLVLADRSQYEKGLEYLHRASMLNPNDPKILTALSGVYLRLGSSLMAARTLEQARQLAPKDANILATLGEIYREEKEYELSKLAFESALEIEPTFVAAETGLALNLMQIGQLAQAGAILEKKVREGSRSISFLYMLSQLPPSLVSLNIVSLLDEATPHTGKAETDEFRAQLGFSKAAALDKAGRYEEAWACVSEARRYNLVENRKAYGKFREKYGPLLELARACPPNPEANAEASSDDPISLFIVGPSRSGKTTLERLLESLPGVKRGYENPIVENAVRLAFQTAGLPTRYRLAELPPQLSELFRRFYREELAKRADSAQVLTNTLPARTQDALRAASEIPNARFILIKRDLDDLSIRIFMRNYKTGNYYASDMRDIRDYLSWCHQMIDIMAEKMPLISRVLTYEEMVADPAATLAEAAELCGLQASDAMLPSVGDDRGCADPYRDHIEAALRQCS